MVVPAFDIFGNRGTTVTTNGVMDMLIAIGAAFAVPVIIVLTLEADRWVATATRARKVTR